MSRRVPSIFRFLLFPLTIFPILFLVSCNEEAAVLEPLPAAAAGAVAGTLLADDTAVADAVVRLEPMADGLPLSVASRIAGDVGSAESAKSALNRIRVTTSDDQGWYVFTGLDAGGYLLSVQAADHLGGNHELEITTEAFAAAETTYVDIALVPTGTYNGNATLQNATDHASTVVYVTGTASVAVTDPAGDYTLTGVPTGTHTIRATHSGWLDQSTGGTLAAAGDDATLAGMVLLREANITPTVSILPLITFPALTVFEPIPFMATAADADGAIVLVEWDFEDDGTFDYSDPSSLTVTWPMTTAGSYRAKIRVTDDMGGIGLAVLEYSVYDAIYVWGAGGDDNGLGSRDEPVQTIQEGISLAGPLGLPVIVHTGTYAEEVAFRTHVSVYGGYDREAGWTRAPGSYSTVWLQSYYEHTALVQNVSNLTIKGLRIEAEPAQGDATAAVALKLIDCGPTVLLVDCQIIAGSGAAAFTVGEAGEPGYESPASENGENGCRFQAECWEVPLGGVGYPYDGGRGGYGSPDPQDGESGGGSAGGIGGATRTSTGIAGNGQHATADGSPGSNGANALWGPAGYGTVAALDWVPERGNPGFEGNDAYSGSGGGGGGGVWVGPLTIMGGGGGGGGSKGYGGDPGAGGYSGGASIAVLCINCTAVIDSCYIEAGNGGNGWRGGIGGPASPGLPGGLGGSSREWSGSWSGSGGNGSAGGDGGHAGGGQGGPGGPSVGVYNYNGAPTLIGITYVIGTGGTGGPGGMHGDGSSSQGPTGGSGPSATVYDHP